MFPIEKNFPYIVGCVGSPLGSGFGTGKTLGALECAIYLANKYRLSIASNISLNRLWLRRYCLLKGYKFLAASLKYEAAYRFIDDYLKIPSLEDCVILFDEVGQHLDARGFSEKPRQQFLKKLITIRHRNCYIFYTAHDGDQIDKILRNRTDNFLVCSSVQKFDCDDLMPKLKARSMFLLVSDKYERYRSDPRIFSSPLKTGWLARGQYRSEVLFFARLTHYLRSFLPWLGLLKKFCYRRFWRFSDLVAFDGRLQAAGFWDSPTDVLFRCFHSRHDVIRRKYDFVAGFGLVPRGANPFVPDSSKIVEIDKYQQKKVI